MELDKLTDYLEQRGFVVTRQTGQFTVKTQIHYKACDDHWQVMFSATGKSKPIVKQAILNKMSDLKKAGHTIVGYKGNSIIDQLAIYIVPKF